MEKSLSAMTAGESGKVKRVTAEGRIKRRLFDMGLTPGAEVLVRKLAPLGDPIEINLRGYELTLRKEEAQWIAMEVKG